MLIIKTRAIILESFETLHRMQKKEKETKERTRGEITSEKKD